MERMCTHINDHFYDLHLDDLGVYHDSQCVSCAERNIVR